MGLESHIARLERETALAQALQAEQRAEQRYRGAGTNPALRAQRAAELHIARYRAAQEEEDSDSI
jgi:hypothetical protein